MLSEPVLCTKTIIKWSCYINAKVTWKCWGPCYTEWRIPKNGHLYLDHALTFLLDWQLSKQTVSRVC